MRQEERIKANEETFKLYQNELENRALRIKRLEMQLSIQSDQIYSLKKEAARLKCERTPPASPNTLGFSSSASPESSHSASTVPEDSSSSSSSSSAAAAAELKEALATMAAEHSRTAAELSAVNETLLHYKTLGTTAFTLDSLPTQIYSHKLSLFIAASFLAYIQYVHCYHYNEHHHNSNYFYRPPLLSLFTITTTTSTTTTTTSTTNTTTYIHTVHTVHTAMLQCLICAKFIYTRNTYIHTCEI